MCEHGNTKQIEIDGYVRNIDFCIYDIIKALNEDGVTTVASCCGHKNPSLGNICLKDGRVLAVFQDFETAESTWKIIAAELGNIHGEFYDSERQEWQNRK